MIYVSNNHSWKTRLLTLKDASFAKRQITEKTKVLRKSISARAVNLLFVSAVKANAAKSLSKKINNNLWFLPENIM
jgi:hypothetical protein